MAAAADKDPSILLYKLLNMSDKNRSIAGGLLRKIYTNTSFEQDLGAFIRVSFYSILLFTIGLHNITFNYVLFYKPKPVCLLKTSLPYCKSLRIRRRKYLITYYLYYLEVY